jgi:hypothetical protein
MSLSVVRHAEKLGSHSATKMIAVVTDPDVKCILSYAPGVASKLKCHSSHAETDQYIAAIATVRLNQANNAGFLLRKTQARVFDCSQELVSPHHR